MKKLKDLLGWLNRHQTAITFVFIAIILALSVRGIFGNPTPSTINNMDWKENGPFELSPERGRFALLYSVVENQSFQFSLSIAQFATPDVGFANGHYVSLFAPGVSFIVMPGYLLGKYFGTAQFGVYATIALFAFLNSVLIYKISKSLFGKKEFSLIASLIFLFATPAFAYAVSLFQHHISTFLILSCIYLLLGPMKAWKVALIWFLIAVGVTVDYPNGLMMAPIGLYTFSRFFVIKNLSQKIVISFKHYLLATFVIILIPLILFLQFNRESFGDPFQLSGTVESVQAIGKSGQPIFTTDPKAIPERLAPPDKSAIGFFVTRNFLNGFYIHLLSPDRGIIVFTPIILFGLIGLILAITQGTILTPLLLSICGVNFLLYSMWGDPWGGWAFGSRYLVPSYAILSLFIPLVLKKIWNKRFLMIIFYLAFVYSLAVNTLGALTSSRIPPQTEVLQLEAQSHHQEKYSFNRDMDLLSQNISKSFLYNVLFKTSFTATQYYVGIVAATGLFATIILLNQEEVPQVDLRKVRRKK